MIPQDTSDVRLHSVVVEYFYIEAYIYLNMLVSEHELPWNV